MYSGNYLTQYQLEAHVTRENRRRLALSHLRQSSAQKDNDHIEPPQGVAPASGSESAWSDDDESWKGISGLNGTLNSIEETVVGEPTLPQSTRATFLEELGEVKTALETTPISSFIEALERVPLVYIIQPESPESLELSAISSDLTIFDLEVSAESNFAILQYQMWLEEISAYLDYQSHRKMSSTEHARYTVLTRQVVKEADELRLLCRRHWVKRHALFKDEMHRRVETSRIIFFQTNYVQTN